MNNNDKIEQAQLDIKTANDAADTRESLRLTLCACELLAAVVSDQQDEIEALRARMDDDPSLYDQRRKNRWASMWR